MFRFQKLEIYHLAKDLVKKNYQLIKKFPSEEKFVLIQQMNRAAISVPSNIVEGVSRYSDKEKIHFLSISYGSLMELICQMEISLELKYINQVEYDDFIKNAKILSIKISNFINALKNNNQ